MAKTNRGRPRTGRQSYHHGDLRRALVQQALETIRAQGVDALTVRSIGTTLGVSRTALYRHFPDKAALLGAVGKEGFRLVRRALEDARRSHDNWSDGFREMGRAYLRFAREHSAHYRVMFGGYLDACVAAGRPGRRNALRSHESRRRHRRGQAAPRASH